MLAPFTKMHGCGNDFVVFDERAEPFGITPALARALADRRTGIGCDQVISLEPASPGSGAAVFMRIRNADGTEAGACGNATRCVGSLIARDGGGRELVVATAAGKLPVVLHGADEAEVDMGPPGLGWRDVPLAEERDTLFLALAAYPALPPEAAALSMGNPHATFFVPDLTAVPVAAVGPALERHPLFSERANIGFAQVLGPDRIRLRVWERGAGLTLACGSGACAALVNAHRRGLAGRRATVELDGGALEIAWRETDNHVLMTGPTTTTFTGVVDLAAFGA